MYCSRVRMSVLLWQSAISLLRGCVLMCVSGQIRLVSGAACLCYSARVNGITEPQRTSIMCKLINVHFIRSNPACSAGWRTTFTSPAPRSCWCQPGCLSPEGVKEYLLHGCTLVLHASPKGFPECRQVCASFVLLVSVENNN